MQPDTDARRQGYTAFDTSCWSSIMTMRECRARDRFVSIRDAQLSTLANGCATRSKCRPGHRWIESLKSSDGVARCNTSRAPAALQHLPGVGAPAM
jgi:hypothetical protein